MDAVNRSDCLSTTSIATVAGVCVFSVQLGLYRRCFRRMRQANRPYSLIVVSQIVTENVVVTGSLPLCLFLFVVRACVGRVGTALLRLAYLPASCIGLLASQIMLLLGLADRIQALAQPADYHSHDRKRRCLRINAASYGLSGAVIVATILYQEVTAGQHEVARQYQARDQEFFAVLVYSSVPTSLCITVAAVYLTILFRRQMLNQVHILHSAEEARRRAAERTFTIALLFETVIQLAAMGLNAVSQVRLLFLGGDRAAEARLTLLTAFLTVMLQTVLGGSYTVTALTSPPFRLTASEDPIYAWLPSRHRFLWIAFVNYALGTAFWLAVIAPAFLV